MTVQTTERQYDEGRGVQVTFYDRGVYIGVACTVEYNGKPNSFLHSFMVEEPYRNMGYGTKILRYMIETYGVDTLYVYKNSKAIGLYKRFHFEKVESFDDYMIIMERKPYKSVKEGKFMSETIRLIDGHFEIGDYSIAGNYDDGYTVYPTAEEDGDTLYSDMSFEACVVWCLNS